jgi:hypothetical protein
MTYKKIGLQVLAKDFFMFLVDNFTLERKDEDINSVRGITMFPPQSRFGDSFTSEDSHIPADVRYSLKRNTSKLLKFGFFRTFPNGTPRTALTPVKGD